MEKSKKVLIVAGEASGDQHAASLVREIKLLGVPVYFWGLGGDCLKNEQVVLKADLVSLAVIGFSEVLRNLRTIHAIYKSLLADIDRDKPDLAILVDYPGFNLRLAKELNKRNIPVVYYISPQIWAWGRRRIETIRRTISKMVVFFPFEEGLYRKYGVPVSFVGHPCLDHVRTSMPADDFRKKFSLDPGRRTIGLLAGSRYKEVKTLLPVMLDAAELIAKNSPVPAQVIVLAAPTVPQELIKNIVSSRSIGATIVNNMTYDGIAASDFCIVCSGTATLETAILGTPMAIIYKVNFMTWLYMRALIRIPYIGLVNVVAGRKIVEELIQFDATPERIASYCSRVLADEQKLSSLRQELLAVKQALGDKGASARAAQAIKEFLI